MFNGHATQFNASYFAATYPTAPQEREAERVVDSHLIEIFWDVIGCAQVSETLFHQLHVLKFA